MTELVNRKQFDTFTLQMGALTMMTAAKNVRNNLNMALTKKPPHIAPPPRGGYTTHHLASPDDPYMMHLVEAAERGKVRKVRKETNQSTVKTVVPKLFPNHMTPSKQVTVSEACAGISATTQALNMLGVPYQHLWMSENDKDCQKTLKANYGEGTGTLFGDFLEIDVNDLASADLFVCGFPCQSWSTLNRSDDVGISATNLVAGIIKHMTTYIHNKAPRCFIIENVKGLLTFRDEFKKLMKNLTDDTRYYVDYTLLNSLDFGLPQSRTRVYIVGVLRDDFKPGCVAWKAPEPSTPEGPRRVPISAILDKGLPMDDSRLSETNWKTLMHFTETKDDFWTQPYVVGLNQSARYACAYNGYCPMLSKCHSNAMYLTTEHRYLNRDEVYRLQGFPDSFIKHPLIGGWKSQVGNTMSVPVVAAVIQSIKDVSVIFG